MRKTLDEKIARIRSGQATRKDFILADAKDADMGFGIPAPGVDPVHSPRTRTIQEYRDIIRETVRENLVDIMLMSASTSYHLAQRERLFDGSPVTPAVRANDASDVHVVRGGRYIHQTVRPWRSATLDEIQWGDLSCRVGSAHHSEKDHVHKTTSPGPDLGLYSVTFNNNIDDDLRTLEAFKEFRLEAERKGFRYFLEVFNPTDPKAVDPAIMPAFVNDMIARMLAGVPEPSRPLFLKIPFNGPRAMEELVAYDSDVIVGILGGSAGTTYDAFKMLAESQKYGAKVALYGRKINQAEHQQAFIRCLRLVADGEVSPEEAVHAYHGILQTLGLKPTRSLADDMRTENPAMQYLTSKGAGRVEVGASYASNSPVKSRSSAKTTFSSSSVPETPTSIKVTTSHAATPISTGASSSSTSDFAKMTNEERLTYHRKRIARLFGE